MDLEACFSPVFFFCVSPIDSCIAFKHAFRNRNIINYGLKIYSRLYVSAFEYLYSILSWILRVWRRVLISGFSISSLWNS